MKNKVRKNLHGYHTEDHHFFVHSRVNGQIEVMDRDKPDHPFNKPRRRYLQFNLG